MRTRPSPSTVSFLLLFAVPLPMGFASGGAATAPPCASAGVVIVGTDLGGNPLACAGLVACPLDAPAPCHWNVAAGIQGTGLVNVVVESEAQSGHCATLPTLLGCEAHVHFQHPPGSDRPWSCRADSLTVALLVELDCTAVFDGVR